MGVSSGIGKKGGKSFKAWNRTLGKDSKTAIV